MVDRNNQHPLDPVGSRTLTRGVLQVVIPYVLLAALWILLSDQLVEAFFQDPVRRSGQHQRNQVVAGTTEKPEYAFHHAPTCLPR